MLRYEFCAHALIVLALLNFLRQFRTAADARSGIWHGGSGAARRRRAKRAGLVRLEFTRGNWVA